MKNTIQMKGISIIIPTFKEPLYLDLCLRSIESSQYFPSNEIIVVCDGFFDMNEEVIMKYSDTLNLIVINFKENKGLHEAINTGVRYASKDYILVMNDDNVVSNDFDQIALIDCSPNKILSINQIEPPEYSQMFKSFVKMDLGKVEDFDLNAFVTFEKELGWGRITNDGWTFPFMMRRIDFLRVGGFENFYESPNLVDWSFFMRCQMNGMTSERTHKTHMYHFGGKATKSTPEVEAEFRKKEAKAFDIFQWVWKCHPYHDAKTNSNLPIELRRQTIN